MMIQTRFSSEGALSGMGLELLKTLSLRHIFSNIPRITFKVVSSMQPRLQITLVIFPLSTLPG